ncbi:hypothetical protein NBO_4g0045 [Nosema bombycis CQ1]|uniref:Peptidase A2 domain-containing protein n=1 Tax=Nosema bombycis (strain CQ1 / CVCC 102059) TaxID=578461 RepID=R0KZ13_NOSB1|nr:hypothetical protein NBO_4g0045 [Nosema bombycis CQ1]|eukprot:EOB15417.1 hypothetical protein NBO_4g0045 [Nosema bombycis CQ1]
MKKPTPGTTFTTAQGIIPLLIDTQAVQNLITITGLRKLQPDATLVDTTKTFTLANGQRIPVKHKTLLSGILGITSQFETIELWAMHDIPFDGIIGINMLLT